MTLPSNDDVTINQLATSLLICEQTSSGTMFLRFLHVANSNNNVHKFETPKLPAMPTASLEKLAVETRRLSEDIDWDAIHHEVGEVGLGRWGQMCVDQFRCIKNTRQYRRWVMQRRRYSMSSHYQASIGASLPSSSSSPISKWDDSYMSLDSSLDDSMLSLSGDVDVDYDDSCQVIDKANCNKACAETKVHGEKEKLSNCCGNGDEKTEDNHVSLEKPSVLYEAKVCPNRCLSANSGTEPEVEVSDTEKNIETEVQIVLTFIVEKVCKTYVTKVVRNVLMSLIDDVSTGRITDLQRGPSLPPRLLTHLFHVTDYEWPEEESDLFIDSVPAAYLEHTVDDNISLETEDLSAEFQESINILDAVIQEHDEDGDKDGHEDPGVITKGSQDDCIGTCSRTYRNIKCSVSVETVLRELEKGRLDGVSADENSSQISPEDSGTVSVMFGKDSEVQEPDGEVKEPESDAKEKGDSTEGGNGLHETAEACSSIPQFIYLSYSAPCVLMTSPYSTDSTPVQSSRSDQGQASDFDDLSSIRTSVSEVVIDKPCGDACEQFTSDSSSSFSDSTDSDEAEETAEEAEVEVQVDESEQNNDDDAAGPVRDNISEDSRGGSLAGIVDRVPSGNALFLLDKSVTDSELGIEVIELDEDKQQHYSDQLSEASFQTIKTCLSDKEREQSESFTDASSQDLSPSRPATSNIFGTTHGKGGCHVS